MRAQTETPRSDRAKLLKPVLFTLGGAVVGFLYYRFVGCQTGTCPITSNPIISTLYGALIGFLFGRP